MTERSARIGLLVFLGAYLVAGAVYSLLAPLGEAPDEMEQFWYLRYLVVERRLPRTDADRVAAGGKSHEPPLYYALLGLATSWVDASGGGRIKMLGPERFPRHSLPDEVLINFAPLHTADEYWPYRGEVLIWHLARLGSLLIMAGALALVYPTVRELVPSEPGLALLAAVAVGLTPQCIYIGASLNNDALCALLGTLLLWTLARLARVGPRWGLFMLIGLWLGLSRLTKFYMLALLPVAVLALVLLAWRRRDLRYGVGAVLVLGLALGIPAPWMLYIEPVDPAILEGSGRWLALLDIVHVERWFSPAGEGQAGTGAAAIARALAGALTLEPRRWAATLFKSFWGYFGAMTVQAPWPVYALGALLSTLSGAGWMRAGWRVARGGLARLVKTPHLWLAGLQVGAMLGTEAVFYGVMRRLPDTAQARHLYPALAGLGLGLALGWRGLSRRATTAPVVAALGGLLLVLAAASLPTVYHSVRRPYLPVRSVPWPDAPETRMSVPIGDGVVFEGARWATGPGRIYGDLYWRADQSPRDELVIVLRLTDEAGAVCAVWSGHPGGSRYPTRSWSAGDYVRGEVVWPLPPGCKPGTHTVHLEALYGGQERVAVPIGTLALGDAVQGGGERAHVLVSGAESRVAGLRDGVLVTGTGIGADALVGPEGASWHPLAMADSGDQMALLVDGRVRPGPYTLPSPSGEAQAVVEVMGRYRRFDVPPDVVPVGVTLGDAVELVGYQLEPVTVAAGETVHLRLAWRAAGWVERHYTVFTHLVGPDGRLVAQHDKLPGEEYSTLFWTPGEVVEDAYTLVVPADAAAGEYELRVGMYRALGGERAPVRWAAGEPAGDHVVVSRVQVVGN